MEKAPTTEREERLWSAGLRSVAGVDEVGRGAAVAAVVAAAVVLPVGFRGLDAVRDSKLLPPLTRRRLATAIRQVAVVVALGAASPLEIERLNVRGATALAMQRALRRASGWDHAIVDGLPMRELPAERCTAVVDGDALCLSIACASIVAKVARDDLLRLLAKRHPGYGWEHNAGYLTPEHRAAVRRFGPTPHHRQGFLRTTLATCEECLSPM
ncbi:MAG TPA: ribonuclease HII [Chloroflexota bacterium]|jgi:ribonuclease HII|nr:ribonuclease HII [Chloroflexota bacterium]